MMRWYYIVLRFLDGEVQVLTCVDEEAGRSPLFIGVVKRRTLSD
jgi:hypothetical protein